MLNQKDTDGFSDKRSLLHRTKFVILLSLQIPSILISLFIFGYFIRHRALIRVPQNKGMLLLLIVNFIQLTCDLPMPINFYRIGRVAPATASYCTWWTFFEYTLFATSEYLMTIISIQRHIFVFYHHLIQVQWKNILVHYVPFVVCLLYPIILYTVIIVFYSCDGTQWDYTSNLCGLANCYLVYNKTLGTFDWSFNNGLPTFLTLISDMILLVRVIRQKKRNHQELSWQKRRHMMRQLLGLSFLTLFSWLPNVIMGIIQQLDTFPVLNKIQTDYVFDLVYTACLLMPFFFVWLIPELKRAIRTRVMNGRIARHRVGPLQLIAR